MEKRDGDMTYETGWKQTPEMKAIEQHRIEMFERLERERKRDLRRAEVALGVSVFFIVLAPLIPLIVRAFR